VLRGDVLGELRVEILAAEVRVARGGELAASGWS
jgi:hypothetical protein